MNHSIVTGSDLYLRVLLGALAAYHLGIGVASVTSYGSTAALSHHIYGLGLGDDPQFRYSIKMLGLYALVFGGLIMAAAWHPYDNRATIIALISLQLLRALFRVRFANHISTGFGVTLRRNAMHATLLLAEVAALIWLFPVQAA
ncbi:MAG: hypothetical protein ACR2M1_02380 [Gemmatimonadaceae bacterium]